MEKYIVTYDLITSGAKTSAFSITGRLAASAYRALPISIAGAHVEQNPDDWWNAIVETTRELLNEIEPEQVEAICFSAQSQVCLCVDQRGVPLMNALTWADTRSLEIEDAIGLGISREEHFALTGIDNKPNSSIRKLMWIKQKRPDVYEKTYKMIQCKDYLVAKFTGRICTDFSDASSTFALDVKKRKWSKKILALAGIDIEKLPEMLESNTVVGGISEDAARETGLRAGTRVVLGGGDVPCNAIGAGCVHPGDLYMSLGSSSWMAKCTNAPVEDAALMRPVANPHSIPGLYISFIGYQDAGVMFKWLKNGIFCDDPQGRGAVRPFENIYPYGGMEEAVKQSPVGANGLICLPHLLGPTANHPEQYTRGAFIGLHWTHTREDMMRAALEGVTFELRRMVDLFRDADTRQMTVVGIASHEQFWLQMMADMFNLNIRNTELTDTPDSIGAAIIAGQAIGVYDDFDQADRFRKFGTLFIPNPVNVRRYERIYAVYAQAFADISGTLRGIRQAFEA